MKHLWEVQHPYYCEEQNYFAGRDRTVNEYSSWKEFLVEFGEADFDYNLLFRWDWKSEDGDVYDPTVNDDNYRDGKLMLFWMGQRKGRYFASVVDVCRADEPKVIEFLRPRYEHLRKLWAPLS